MNPLPNRPLLNNNSIPLLPNVPSFDQMAYNGRPRKILPETNSMMNGMNLMAPGPSSAPATSNGQVQPLERGNPLGSGMLPHLQQQLTQQQQHHQIQQQQQPPHFSQPQQQHSPPLNQQPPPPQTQGSISIERHSPPKGTAESDPRTAIFLPDNAGDWKEKLRLSHEASEQTRLSRESSISSWENRKDDQEEDPEADDDDSSVTSSESDGGKIWKAKRTLRK